MVNEQPSRAEVLAQREASIASRREAARRLLAKRREARRASTPVASSVPSASKQDETVWIGGGHRVEACRKLGQDPLAWRLQQRGQSIPLAWPLKPGYTPSRKSRYIEGFRDTPVGQCSTASPRSHRSPRGRRRRMSADMAGGEPDESPAAARPGSATPSGEGGPKTPQWAIPQTPMPVLLHGVYGPARGMPGSILGAPGQNASGLWEGIVSRKGLDLAGSMPGRLQQIMLDIDNYQAGETPRKARERFCRNATASCIPTTAMSMDELCQFNEETSSGAENSRPVRRRNHVVSLHLDPAGLDVDEAQNVAVDRIAEQIMDLALKFVQDDPRGPGITMEECRAWRSGARGVHAKVGEFGEWLLKRRPELIAIEGCKFYVYDTDRSGHMDMEELKGAIGAWQMEQRLEHLANPVQY